MAKNIVELLDEIEETEKKVALLKAQKVEMENEKKKKELPADLKVRFLGRLVFNVFDMFGKFIARLMHIAYKFYYLGDWRNFGKRRWCQRIDG